MPLVQVADLGLDAEGPEEAPAPDPEDQFLVQPQLGPAAVELARDPPEGRRIGRVVAVEKIEPDPPDLDLPDAQPDLIAGDGQVQPQPFPVRLAHGRHRQLPGVVVREISLLGPRFVDDLTKIALLVEKPDADDRQAELARGLELIAGHVAQSPGIDRQGLAEHELHAEVGDGGQSGAGVVPLEPGRRVRLTAFVAQQAGDRLVKAGVGHGSAEPVPRHGLQDDPGTVGPLPEPRVELLPDLVGGMVPGPAHVEGQLGQLVEPLDIVGKERIDRAADAPRLFHDPTPSFREPSGLPPRRASSTMAWASLMIRRRWSSPRKLSA